MNDNQRMEVRAIGQEVLDLIYEWVSEEENEEDNNVEEIATSTLNCNINTDLNNKLPHQLLNHHDDQLSNEECNKITPANDFLRVNDTKSISNKEGVLCNVTPDVNTNNDAVKDYIRAINLTKRRLELMEKLGFKVISRLDTCSKIVEYSEDSEDMQTALTYLQKGHLLAKMLYGTCSLEESKWKLAIDRVNKSLDRH